MANPIPKPILGAFEDIGEQIVSQVKQIPKDVGQAALESIGLAAGTKSGQTTQPVQTPGTTGQESSHWQQFDQTHDKQIKKEIARKALQELLSPASKPKEPSIWEKNQREEEQKKAMQKQQNQPGPVQLPSSGARKVPGLKSSVKAKQLGSEVGKNARQD